MSVCVIGGGIFGLIASIYLSKISKKVDVYEKNSKLLTGATLHNHNRHHFGFHYPRSQATTTQCLKSVDSFNKYYKSALDFNFKNFYAISKYNSKINGNFYEDFLNKNKLKYKKEFPKNIFNKSKIESCYLVEEGVYNYSKLASITLKRLNTQKNIKIFTDTEAKCFINAEKRVVISKKNSNSKQSKKYDLVINACYDDTNENLSTSKDMINFEYNLQEMSVIQIPNFFRFGSTVLDGEFPSILPIAGKKNEYYFAHVKTSQILKLKSKNKPLILSKFNPFHSNWQNTKEESIKYLKILDKAKYLKSFFVIRAVDTNKKTDSRKSEILKYKNGNLSIFSGKIITVETLSKKIFEEVKKNYGV